MQCNAPHLLLELPFVVLELSLEALLENLALAIDGFVLRSPGLLPQLLQVPMQ